MAGFDPLTAVTNLINKGLDKFVMDKGQKEKLAADMTVFAAQEATKQDGIFRQFILEYEGAAKDYKDIPFIGSLVLLFRGLIRPAFTVAVMFWDWRLVDAVLAGKTTSLNIPPHFMAMMAGINLIILIFWFGERSIQYIMPLLMPMIRSYTGMKIELNQKNGS